jgi:formamidopyrimidine-DNA glycosylase
MTGSLRTGDAGADDDGDHDRVRLTLDDGRRVTFRDPRRFGRVSVVPAGVYLPGIPTLASLGPEPLSPRFTPGVFAAAILAGAPPR